MFVVRREDIYTIKTKDAGLLLVQEYEKKFLDEQFIPIILFLANKGLHIEIPSVIDGWDATFIYRQLDKEAYVLGRPAEELALFIYSRLKNNQNIALEHRSLFRF